VVAQLEGMWWLSWWGCGGSVGGDVVAQLVGIWWLSWWGYGGSVGLDVVAHSMGMWWLRRLSEPDCNAAVPGSIPASSTLVVESTVSRGAAGIMTVYQNQISGCEASLPE
jgi:hypothetical protein